MKQQIKTRIESFTPEIGLEGKESYFIRSSSAHQRGGTSEYFKVLINNNFDFNCIVTQLGIGKSINFYYNGRIPIHLIPLLKAISNNSKFKEISTKTEIKFKLQSYGGNLDISFKIENEYNTYYIDCSDIYQISKNENNRENIFLSHFNLEFSKWLYSMLDFNYVQLLQKGIFGFEMEYK